jgi:hypothetical protein
MSYLKRSVLETFITTFFNVESDDIEVLVNWVKNGHHTTAEAEILEFRRQLREALDKPGIITPAVYERCTGNDALDSQAKVQQRLQETWDACFG